MKYWIEKLVFALLLVMAAPSYAALEQLGLRIWRTADGLPHNLIHDLAQTDDRYVWLTTWEGVARFDGLQFTHFNSDNTPQLGGRGVRALAVDHDGGIWFGTTRQGITRYFQGQWSQLGTDDGLAANQILDLLVDRKNNLWIATEDNGISVLSDGTFRNIAPEQLLDSTILSLHEASDGAIWSTTRQGINVIAGDQIRQFDQRHGLPASPIHIVFESADQQTYVGSEQGLYMFDGDRFVAEPRWPEQHAVSVIADDLDGGLYVGSFNHGLFQLSADGSQHQLTTRTGLPNNRITALLHDAEGHLWVGTSGGLTQLIETAFSTQTTRTGLSDDYVRTVLQTTDDTIWVGTGNGLNRLDAAGWRQLTTADGLASNSILSLAARDNELWVGTYGAGVSIVRDGKASPLAGPALPSGHIRSILHGRDGSTWIGTVAGLARRTSTDQGHQQTVFDKVDGLPRAFIHSLHETRDGVLWIGTAEGMARFENNQITSLDGSEGYDGSGVFAFEQDADGGLWIATETGLLHYQTGASRFTKIGQFGDLPSTAFFSILIDQQQRLWLSSNRGIFQVPLQQLQARVAGEKTKPDVQVFTEEDGLATRQSNGGSEPAATILSDQRIVFATAGGAAFIDSTADDFDGRRTPPTVVLEQVIVNRQPVAPDAVEITTADRTLAFQFAGIHHGQPGSLRYSHRVAGFNDWSELTAQRSIQYTNLPPGEYMFEVRAWIPDVWSEQAATVAIEVVPRFYQVRWVQWLAALLSLILLSALVSWRISAFRRRATELGLLVDERTKDLQQQTRRLIKADRDKSELLSQIANQAQEFEHQAKHDALTKLPNRRHFDTLLHQKLSTPRDRRGPLAVAILDIDHFKTINDRFSHQAGDNALSEFGQLLRDHLTPHQAVVARYGGEEFVALFSNTDAAAAAEHCEHFREAVERHEFGRTGDGFELTVSIGISDDFYFDTHDKLLNSADTKLYEAKNAGRNRVVH